MLRPYTAPPEPLLLTATAVRVEDAAYISLGRHLLVFQAAMRIYPTAFIAAIGRARVARTAMGIEPATRFRPESGEEVSKEGEST